MDLLPGRRILRASAALIICASLLFASAVAAPAAAPANPAPPVVVEGAVPVVTEPPAAKAFNPAAPPQPVKGKVVEVHLDAVRAKLELAPGDVQEVWTFGGQVPAPTIRVHQGDTLRIVLTNKDPEMEHGLDFHAGQMDSGTFHKPIQPGESQTFEFVARYPGVFYYHCSAGPVIMHIANGMFGAVIVDPPGYQPKGKEYVLIQHEWYPNLHDLNGMLTQQPKAVAFNGVPNQYLNKPLTAAPGEPVRFYFVDAGPNHFSAFHVIGTIFDRVMPDGNPANAMYGVQTITIPPGGAAITDLVADTGTYPILTHVMKDATLGALGILQVGTPAGGHDPGPGPSPEPDPEPEPEPDPEPPATGTTVHLSAFAFAPKVLKVKAGQTVTWVNMEATDHSVIDANAKTPAERLFDSTGEKDGRPVTYMKKGDTFSFTFDTPGTYQYRCRQHPFMTGTIIVE
jgi:nitrite reductase (NO-forming)